MRIDQFEVFVALADERHFGRAADRLGMTTSTVSKRLQDLEAGIRIRLFDRTSRRVALTPEAGPLLDEARRVLAAVEAFRDVVAETTKGNAGTVRLFHASNHFDIVARLVRSVRSRHPDLALHFLERPNEAIAPAVRSGEASLGMCWGPAPPGLKTHCFDVLMLDTIFVPATHPLAHRPSVDLADLDGETFILTGPDPAQLWRHTGIEVTVRNPPISGRDEIATRVETGEGIVLTSSRAVPRYQHRAVVAVPLADPEAWGRLDQLLVWRGDDDSPALRSVLQVATRLR